MMWPANWPPPICQKAAEDGMNRMNRMASNCVSIVPLLNPCVFQPATC